MAMVAPTTNRSSALGNYSSNRGRWRNSKFSNQQGRGNYSNSRSYPHSQSNLSRQIPDLAI